MPSRVPSPPEGTGGPVSRTFRAFIDSEKAGGFVLLGCTVLSLVLANSAWGEGWIDLWHAELGGSSVEHWINDGLMAVFFLLIGLELERELYVGELSDAKRALLPAIAAVGGVALPALIAGDSRASSMSRLYAIPSTSTFAPLTAFSRSFRERATSSTT